MLYVISHTPVSFQAYLPMPFVQQSQRLSRSCCSFSISSEILFLLRQLSSRQVHDNLQKTILLYLVMHPNFIEFPAFRETRCPFFNHKQTNAPMFRFGMWICFHNNEYKISINTICDKRLLTIHNIVITVFDCRRLDIRKI